MTEGGSLGGIVASNRSPAPRWRAWPPAWFVLAFVAIGLSVGAYSLATPLLGAPDEPAHIAQAAAIVRGQFDLGHVPGPDGPVSPVTVPAWVAPMTLVPCYAAKPQRSAACAPAVGTGTAPTTASTQFSNYPPLYFLIVGTPTLVLVGSHALYAMRLVSDLINVGLMALGLFLLARYHPRRLPLIGALVALTPMVLFMTSAITTSGLEIAAAFACWCGGLCIIERATVPRPLAIGTALAFTLVILSRPISPVNAGIVMVVLGAMAGKRRIRHLIGERSARPVGVFVVPAVMAAGILLLVGGAPVLLGPHPKPPLSDGAAVRLVMHDFWSRMRQCIGYFGWGEIPAPTRVVEAWAAAVAVLGALGLALSSRCRRALPLLALAIVAMPLVFEAPKINTVGPYWQGRYWLPVCMGLPLVASALRLPRTRLGSRLSASPSLRTGLTAGGVAVVGAVLVLAQVATFLHALRRYQVGLGVPHGTPVTWSPPGGASLVIAIFVAGQVLLVGFVAWHTLRTRATPRAVPARQQPVSAGDPSSR